MGRAVMKRADNKLVIVDNAVAAVQIPIIDGDCWQIHICLDVAFEVLRIEDFEILALGCHIDSVGNIYFCGVSNSPYLTVRKYTSDGTTLWSYNSGSLIAATRITTDDELNIYVVFGNNNLVKFNSSGTIQWTYTPTFGLVEVDLERRIYTVGGFGGLVKRLKVFL